ncbi:MAG: sodium-dependent bicarbonate transport family permease, partial [Gaiella sp.]
ARAEPVFVDAFYGVLVVFLLGLGIAVGRHVGDLHDVGPRLVVFGVVAPLVQGTLGVVLGTLAGLGTGGAAVLGVMAASASYIAAPAAVRPALPTASPAVSLVPALGITFPLNLTLGIPLFYAVADLLA